MKILVVRFSSIGDIVLTSSIVRAIKMQLPKSEIHYLTKKQFIGLLDQNPHIDTVHTIEKHINEVVSILRKEHFDWVIDLHNNLRTLNLKLALRRPTQSFEKMNWKKWLMVRFKWNKLPELHVVDRYFNAVKHLGVLNDNFPGDFFIRNKDKIDVLSTFGIAPKTFITVAIGAQFKTKQLPLDKLLNILSKIDCPVILIGGKQDIEKGNAITARLTVEKVINSCGKYSITQSASIVQQSAKLLTNDTGMMHIAACFDVEIVSVWGNTIPKFGMYPYLPNKKSKYSIFEVQGLNCRPCSKIGFDKCPKGHFKCMMDQDEKAIIDRLILKKV